MMNARGPTMNVSDAARERQTPARAKGYPVLWWQKIISFVMSSQAPEHPAAQVW